MKQNNEKSEVPDEEVGRASDVGAKYKVTPRYVYKLAERGVIPCIRIGKCVRFRMDEVAAAIAKKGGLER